MKKLLMVTLLLLASQVAFASDVCEILYSHHRPKFTKTCTNTTDEAVKIVATESIFMIKEMIELGYQFKSHSQWMFDSGSGGDTWIFIKP